MIVGLIACGKAKLDHPAPAADLYVGGFFLQARRYIETVSDEWAILSAKHGLVMPDQVIEPYDVTLSTMPALKRQAWARVVGRQLRSRYPADTSYVTTASKLYRTALEGLDVTCPFDQLECKKIGYQKQFLARAR